MSNIVPNLLRAAIPGKLILGPDDTAAYIDTVELFFRLFPRDDPRCLTQRDWQRLYKIHGWVEPREVKGENGMVWGVVLPLHQPSRQCLRQLDRLQERCEAKLCRLDISIDFSVPENLKQFVRDYLATHCVLKWRRAQPMHDEENTVSFIQQADRKRRSLRDLIIYCDRESKVTGEVDVVHLELKLLSAAAIRQVGFRYVYQLLRLDPSEVVQRCVKLVDFDVENWRRNVLRKLVKNTRDQLLPTDNQWTDRWIAELPSQVDHILDRLTQDRAQIIKTEEWSAIQPVTMRTLSWEPWQLPTMLSWRGFGGH